MSGGPSSGLLQGVRVLDLGIWRPVPYATQLLAEMGADVIKVEPPGGDPMRVFPDLFAMLNAGKRTVTVDLKDESQRAAVLDRAREADAVLEGFRPGVATRLGMDYAAIRALNPRVVYCSVSGYGQTGPRRDVPGHDVNYQAVAGLLEPRDAASEPVLPRPPLADVAGGVYAAMAVCAGLACAARTGEGDYIDVAMADVLTTWTGPVSSLRLADGRPMHGGAAGYGVFRTRDDKWIALGVVDEQLLWRALVSALGLDDLVDVPFAERSVAVAELNARIAAAVNLHARDELVDRLTGAGVPVSPVLGQTELPDDAHLRERGVVRRDPNGATEMRHPLHYTRHGARVVQGAPMLTSVGAPVPAWG